MPSTFGLNHSPSSRYSAYLLRGAFPSAGAWDRESNGNLASKVNFFACAFRQRISASGIRYRYVFINRHYWIIQYLCQGGGSRWNESHTGIYTGTLLRIRIRWRIRLRSRMLFCLDMTRPLKAAYHYQVKIYLINAPLKGRLSCQVSVPRIRSRHRIRIRIRRKKASCKQL